MLSHAGRSVPTSRNRSKQGPIFARESLKMLQRCHSLAVLIIITVIAGRRDFRGSRVAST
jgi:hypothetical protein